MVEVFRNYDSRSHISPLINLRLRAVHRPGVRLHTQPPRRLSAHSGAAPGTGSELHRRPPRDRGQTAMTGTRETTSPARIVTVSAAEWNRHRHEALAQRSGLEGTPHSARNVGKPDLLRERLEIYRKLVEGMRRNLARSEAILADMEAKWALDVKRAPRRKARAPT
jgi:hypothetical protein